MANKTKRRKLGPNVELSAQELYKLNRGRGKELDRQRACDKDFPAPGDQSVELTQTPAEFVHPVARRSKRTAD